MFVADADFVGWLAIKSKGEADIVSKTCGGRWQMHKRGSLQHGAGGGDDDVA